MKDAEGLGGGQPCDMSEICPVSPRELSPRITDVHSYCGLFPQMWILICLTQKQVRSGLMSNRGGAIRRETPGTSVLPENPFLTL